MRPELQRSPASPPPRFVFVDGMRGIAALCVAWFHLYSGGGGQLIGAGFMPAWFVSASVWGRFGVQVFFVMSGFVIAHSLNNEGCMRTLRSLGRFSLRRSIRLDPTYWIAVLIGGLAIYAFKLLNLSSDFVDQSALTLKGIVLNMFYLNYIFDTPALVGVFWTIALEVQLYLFFAFMLYVGAKIAGRVGADPTSVQGKVLLVTCLASNLWPLGVVGYVSGWFFPHLFLFLLGSTCYYATQKMRGAGTIFLTHYGLVAVGLTLFSLQRRALLPFGLRGPDNYDSYIFVGLATAGTLWFVSKLGLMYRLLAARPFQYFGKLSYCIYLFHLTVGVLVIEAAKKFSAAGTSPALCLLAVVAGVVSTILLSHLIHYTVEDASIRMSKRVKLHDGQGEIGVHTPSIDLPSLPVHDKSEAGHASLAPLQFLLGDELTRPARNSNA